MSNPFEYSSPGEIFIQVIFALMMLTFLGWMLWSLGSSLKDLSDDQKKNKKLEFRKSEIRKSDKLKRNSSKYIFDESSYEDCHYIYEDSYILLAVIFIRETKFDINFDAIGTLNYGQLLIINKGKSDLATDIKNEILAFHIESNIFEGELSRIKGEYPVTLGSGGTMKSNFNFGSSVINKVNSISQIDVVLNEIKFTLNSNPRKRELPQLNFVHR